MTSAYSQLFEQGLLASAHAPRGGDGPAPTPAADSKRGSRLQRRRRSSLTIETGSGPIAALRSPTRIAAKALSRLLRGSSSTKSCPPPAHSHSVSLGGLGFKGEVTLPPRQPSTPRTAPRPPPPSRATSSMSMSTNSDDSFLEFDRTSSPPPFAYDFNATIQKQPSHAATLFPHLERHNMTAAELHNALVAPYMPGGQHYPRPHWLLDDDDYDDDYVHPYRRAEYESTDDDDMVC